MGFYKITKIFLLIKWLIQYILASSNSPWHILWWMSSLMALVMEFPFSHKHHGAWDFASMHVFRWSIALYVEFHWVTLGTTRMHPSLSLMVSEAWVLLLCLFQRLWHLVKAALEIFLNEQSSTAASASLVASKWREWQAQRWWAGKW